MKNIDHGNNGINNDEYKILRLHDFNKVIHFNLVLLELKMK